MRLFENLSQWWLKKNARIWGSGCARVMLFTYSVKWNQYKSNHSDPDWIARQALLTRADWRQLDETTLIYEPNGEMVEIVDGLGVVHAIHAVIEIEYEYLLGRRTTIHILERMDMLRAAHHAADEFIAKRLRQPTPPRSAWG
jgi:hypothetical protein